MILDFTSYEICDEFLDTFEAFLQVRNFTNYMWRSLLGGFKTGGQVLPLRQCQGGSKGTDTNHRPDNRGQQMREARVRDAHEIESSPEGFQMLGMGTAFSHRSENKVI